MKFRIVEAKSKTSLLIGSLLLPFVATAEEAPNFKEDVLPIFKENCLDCHNADKQKAELDLSSVESILKGSSGGQVVKAGLPDTSILFMAINHDDDVKPMPDNEPKLPQKEIDMVSTWIAGGLIDVPNGKSLLRKMDGGGGNLSLQSRPENPAFPENLPKVAPPEIIHPLPVMALAASPWLDLFAVNGYEQIYFYGKRDAQTEFEHVGTLPFPEEEIHDLRFSRDGELLIAGGGVGAEKGHVVIYQVRTGERLAELEDEGDIVLSADLSADNKFVAIGTPQKHVKILDVSNGAVRHEIDKHTDWVTTVRFSPDGKKLASGDRNGSIHVWDTATGGIVFTLSEHRSKVTSLDWRGDGQLLASGSEDGKMILWDMKDGWATRSIRAHEQKSETRYTRRTGVLGMSLSPSGEVITTGRDRALRRWKADGGKIRAAENLEFIPTQVLQLPESALVVTGDVRGQIQIWDANELKVVQEISPGASIQSE